MKQKEFLSLAKERMFITLNAAINKTNGISDQALSSNLPRGTYNYTYIIGSGNNNMLVKQVFK